VRSRGAAVTYLSHNASFHSKEQIAPSNRGIKHIGAERRKMMMNWLLYWAMRVLITFRAICNKSGKILLLPRLSLVD
jgi:hypothetical protein